MDADTMKLRLEQWMPIFEAQARSGITKNQWCDENGIRRWEFYERQRQCREYMLKTSGPAIQLPASAQTQPEFVELPAAVIDESRPEHEVRHNEPAANGHMCVEYGKFRINIDGRIDESTLMALIRAVAHA